MSTIGILGGGQLGLMMAQAAKKQGHRIVVLDPDGQCPCVKIADVFVCAKYNDENAVKEMAEQCDVLTYEFENADAQIVSQFIDKFPQGSEALTISQHRYKEKKFAKKLGLKTPHFFKIKSEAELFQIVSFPTLIKTCRFGYDGKGQWLIRDIEDLNEIKLEFPGEYIAEEFIRYDREISVAVARFIDGTVSYPPFENVHEKGILRQSTYPCHINNDVAQKAIDAAISIAEQLEYIGVLAVELFVSGDEVIFNEFAPRPHNSAHLTIECADFSQFDLHIAAITRQPKIEPKMKQSGVMFNVLGQHVAEVFSKHAAHPDDHVYLHWYGKTENRFNRKMGHITLASLDKDELRELIVRWRMSK
jgi:5-(carboxyamino)imidazole ribonucleotide synthase